MAVSMKCTCLTELYVQLNHFFQRHSGLGRKIGKIGLQVDRCFQELILWAQFLELFIPRKALKSFMVQLLLVTSRNLHNASRNLCKKCVLDSCTHPSLKSYIYVLTSPCPHLFGALSQSYLKSCLLGYSPHFPSIKLNTQLSCCAFFLS